MTNSESQAPTTGTGNGAKRFICLLVGAVVVVAAAVAAVSPVAAASPVNFVRALTADAVATVLAADTIEPSTGNPIGTFTPARLLDTRGGADAATVDGQFQHTGAIAAGGTLELTVAGRGPVSPAATAVVLNVTAVNAASAGYVTVYPCGQSRPETSNLNYRGGDVVPNAVVSKVGQDGKVCFYSLAQTDLVVDVTADVPQGGAFAPLTPGRLVDTRPGSATLDGVSVGGGRVAAGEVLQFTATNRGGVPGSARAVLLNVTAVDPSDRGYLTVYPCGATQPTASNVNYVAHDVVANAVLAKVGTAGSVCVYSLADTDVVVDVTGYIDDSAEASSLVPARLFDSRPGEATVDGLDTGSGRLGAGSTAAIQVVGRGGVLAGTTAAVLNVTAVTPDAAGYLTVYPCDAPRPLASTVNYRPGDVVPNSAVAALSATGEVCVYTLAATDLVVDVTGLVVPFDPPADLTLDTLPDAVNAADNGSLPSPELAIEREAGLGGPLCVDEDGGRMRFGANLPVLACFDNSSGLVKIENQASYWVSVSVASGTAVVSGRQYDGSQGARRIVDKAYLESSGAPQTHLPPNGAVNFLIPAPYIGNVTFKAELIRSSSLVAPIVNELIGYIPNIGSDIELLTQLVDKLTDAQQCLDQNSGLGNAPCVASLAVSLSWTLIDHGVGGVLEVLGLPYRLAYSLIKVDWQYASMLGEALAYYGNSFTVLGPNITPSTDTPPVNQILTPQVPSGELYAAGTRICGLTYSGHPTPGAKWSPSVDLNADGGDFDRPITMPWDGSVTQNTSGYGGGWGNSVILTRSSDGYQLFLGHMNAVNVTGAASAGTIIGRAGNTGHTEGTNDHNGAHIHVNASQNGQPAPIVLGATTVGPGVCWVTRAGSGGGAPTPQPTTPTQPSGPLTFTFSQNPFLCDGTSHGLGTLHGAVAGERITFTSPTVSGLLPGTANSSGALNLIWQCNPNEAGQSWTVTAIGQSSGRTGTFTVTGKAASQPAPTPQPQPQPTLYNEVAWGPPGGTVPLFSGGPGRNSNGAAGPAARIAVGSVIHTNCRSYNLAVATSNTGGWWYHIATGTYAGYWTPASVYENGTGPYPGGDALWDPAVPVC